VLPILISVSLTPGLYSPSDRAGSPARTKLAVDSATIIERFVAIVSFPYHSVSTSHVDSAALFGRETVRRLFFRQAAFRARLPSSATRQRPPAAVRRLWRSKDDRPLGTPPNTAIQGYLNDNKVPHLFVASGADKWNDPKHFPWTIGWLPSYRLEARIYARYILKNLPDAKVAVLYQNDDFGNDYLVGLSEGLGDRADKMIVAKQTYETTDPTVDSQVATLQGSGADVLLTAAIPKFAAQAIRKIYDIGWKPTHFLAYVSSSVGSVMRPAGPEKGVGIISATCLKDPTDPQWQDTPE
jgi:Periplasmic binding protein